MSMLTVVQTICGEIGVPVPTTVYGTTDTLVLQLLRLVEKEGIDLSKRGDWQALTFEATHTTTAAEDQGAITSIATNGFRHVKQETMWDRTDTLPVPLIGSTAWQRMKAIVVTGPRYRYRLRGGKLLMSPTPASGHTLAFEYISKNWILGVDGTTYKQRFTLDTDTILLSEDLIQQGTIWRWKKEKGFEYAEDFRTYEAMVKTELGRDGGKETLHMDGQPHSSQPGVFVPQYNWNL